MEDNVINSENNSKHNTEWWRKDNGQWRCDNEKPDNKDKVIQDTFGFSNIHRGAIKVVAALDTDKSTRDATENCQPTLCVRVTLSRKHNKKAGLSRIEITFTDVKKTKSMLR